MGGPVAKNNTNICSMFRFFFLFLFLLSFFLDTTLYAVKHLARPQFCYVLLQPLDRLRRIKSAYAGVRNILRCFENVRALGSLFFEGREWASINIQSQPSYCDGQ